MKFESHELLEPEKLRSADAESGVLSILLNFPDSFDDVSARLGPAHFSTGWYRLVYAELCRQMSAGKGCDFLTISESLGESVSFSDMHALSQSHDHSARGIGKMVDIVIDRYKSRELHRLSGTLATLAFGNEPVQDRIDQAQAELSKLDNVDASDDWVGSHEAAIEHLDLIEQREAGMHQGIPTGLYDFDEMLDGGLQPGNLIVIGARPSMGKAQPMDAMILMRDGSRKTMGAVKAGDLLASIDGAESVVTGVFPQGVKPTVRVTFSDGRSAECCREHLWRVNHRKWPSAKIMDTQSIASLLAQPNMRGRLWIDDLNGDFGHNEELPVDPWMLGALLGDGDMTQGLVRFSKTAQQTLDRLNAALPATVEMSYAGGCDWRLSVPGNTRGKPGSNPLTASLSKLGLMGCYSYNKFVPAMYLTANRDARLGVLRGLLDTDGYVSKTGVVQFSSSSIQLAQDAQAIARSLGYWCKLSTKQPTYNYLGQKLQGRTAYIITISGPKTEELFLFDGKRNRCAPKERIKHVSFDSIEDLSPQECQCISVSHASHLYVTDDYVVTHNTAIALGIALHIAQTHPVGFLSMEMTRAELSDRKCAILGSIALGNIKRPKQGLAYDRVVESVERSKALQFYVSDRSGLNVLQVRSKARALKRKHGLKVLFVDYIGLMQGLDSKQNRNYQIEEITRGLKSLAKELDIAIVALAQVNRGGAETALQIPGLTSLRDSGAIEQDADVVAFIHRYYMADPSIGEEFKNYAILRTAKNRQGRCGDTHLHYLGEQTRFGAWSGPAPTPKSKSSGSRKEL